MTHPKVMKFIVILIRKEFLVNHEKIEKVFGPLSTLHIGLFWVYFGAILESNLGSIWVHFGSILRTIWGPFGVFFGQ